MDSNFTMMLGGVQISLVALFILVASGPGTTGSLVSIVLIVVGTILAAYPLWSG